MIGNFHDTTGGTLRVMEVQLTSDQEAFARRAIESGRLRTEQEAVQEALAL
jgi:Arc/MetJ-type ribon-helix-helix transcriptional regulator